MRRKKQGLRPMREIAGELLSLPCPEGAAALPGLEEAARQEALARGKPLDVYEAALLAQAAKALQGDTRAAQFLREAAGDKAPGEEAQPLTAADLALLRKVAARLEKEPGQSEGGRAAQMPASAPGEQADEKPTKDSP